MKGAIFTFGRFNPPTVGHQKLLDKVKSVAYKDGSDYWVFPSSMNDNQINQALINMGILEDTDRGIFDDNDWDCSGQTLTDKPYISKRTKTRVLVTQTWSIDI